MELVPADRQMLLAQPQNCIRQTVFVMFNVAVLVFALEWKSALPVAVIMPPRGSDYSQEPIVDYKKAQLFREAEACP